MPEYQVFARKYRPQRFDEVIGQEAIVTTLRNAIKHKRLAHAYLFCGARGTGKTTLARLFAKALNCQHPESNGEPCNSCSSCKEITSGHSLDVLEIDGASHRGIDEVRQINETVGYATSTGGYKIYIIDEVHMLTKEAFNALLKTLEEPPPHVKFFFATTEPHKVLPTILSRCQRFNLGRISAEKIVEKLASISKEMGIEIEEEALSMIATLADGGLRDAESLLDQIHSFHAGKISVEDVSTILGMVSRDYFFELDRAGKEGNLAMSFEVAHRVFTQGKDLVHFVESLTEHFRNLLMVKLSGKNAPFLNLTPANRDKYEASAKLYTQEQCLTLLDYLAESQQQIRFAAHGRIALEAILLHVLRSHQRLPVEYLVRRLTELEQTIGGGTPTQPPQPAKQQAAPAPQPPLPPIPQQQVSQLPQKESPSISIDPTPTSRDLGKREKKEPPPPQPPKAEVRAIAPEKQRQYDTLLQFAAVELEGTIQRHRF
ncbi:MAG: DNA polymerase III subunit gamma/tau [Parachlamydia sp.]|nr:DNA polymerase III subunit gamma/tau [Parachlamydia sp.]